MSRTPKILRLAPSNFRRDFRSIAPSQVRVCSDPSRVRLADIYFVNDLPSAITPFTILSDILHKIEQGNPLPLIAVRYLQKQKLLALMRYVEGEITYEKFSELAADERAAREQATLIQKQREEKDAEERDAASDAKIALYFKHRAEEQLRLENSPKYIARLKNQQLRARYGLDQFIDQQLFAKLMQILQRIDLGGRFADDDVIWLTTEGESYYTEILKTTYHEREAQFHASEYNQTNDLWCAVNASKHYRKASQAIKAHNLLTTIPEVSNGDSKLESAICTTHGGVMRDLNRFDEAMEFGNKAHLLAPKNFRPCTLLGAVNFEIGNYDVGHVWYLKASERGASERSIDSDLRSIYKRADKSKREKLKAFLLRIDSVKYSWLVDLK